MPTICVVGDVMLDIDHWCVERDNYEGAALCLKTTDPPSYYPGGAANVAALLASWGCEVDLFGAVGPDLYGVKLHELLQYLGVSCYFKPELPRTIVKQRFHCGEQTWRADDEETQLSPIATRKALALVAINHFDAIVFSDYDKGVFSATVEGTVSTLLKLGMPTIVDPAGDFHSQIWRGGLIATPNVRELHALRWLATPPTYFTAATCGAAPVDVYEGAKLIGNLEPPRQVPVAQVVGAGDAFTAGLALAIAEAEPRSPGEWEHSQADLLAAITQAIGRATEYVARPRGCIYQARPSAS